MTSNGGVAVSSTEVNYLVYRYLQESGEWCNCNGVSYAGTPCMLRGCCWPDNGPLATSFDSIDTLNHRVPATASHVGFVHAAFTFAHESQVHTSDVDPNQVPAGALVTFIQKGMQYLELEANLEVQATMGLHEICMGAEGACNCSVRHTKWAMGAHRCRSCWLD